ncbi:heme-binding protein 2-like protein [Scenedesmus sp. NREL 46B-D3]|nr:heme-binding protein 2-like protein [Scenedesmus sp. NREL 46B-D3]
MMLKSAIVVCVAIMMGTTVANFVAPAFYKGLEGPKFTVLKKIGDNIELRRYEPGSWVSVQRSGMQLDSAMSGTFMKLFGYISGGNAAGAKIEMTAPVLTKVVPGQGPTCESQFTMSFYNPWKYQSNAAAPKPTAAGVVLTDMPALDVYVISFGGWANEAAYKQYAARLMQKLKDEKLAFDSSYWFTAGYDSPYNMDNRHNEVWVPAAAPKVGASSSKPAASG